MIFSMEKKGYTRQAKIPDRSSIEKFLNHKITIHRHLDWRNPTEWLGYSPFLIYFNFEQTIEAILNCAPEPENIFWVRLFAFKGTQKAIVYWNTLYSLYLKKKAELK